MGNVGGVLAAMRALEASHAWRSRELVARTSEVLRPPASDEDLTRLAAFCGGEIPRELEELYRWRDGYERSEDGRLVRHLPELPYGERFLPIPGRAS